MHRQPNEPFLLSEFRSSLVRICLCLIGLALAYWFHPASLAYIFASCLVGALCSLLLLARWKYQAHLGSFGFWIAAIAVLTLGNRFALAVAGYDRSIRDDLWILAQYAAAALFVVFGTLYLLRAYGRMKD